MNPSLHMLVAALVGSICAPLYAGPADIKTVDSLGLTRLKQHAKPGEASPLGAEKFAINDLSAEGTTAKKNTKNQANYLAIDPQNEWSRALQKASSGVSFVSFQVCASQSTVIDVGGARLGLTTGVIPGSLQLMYDDVSSGTPEWHPLNYQVSTQKYEGHNFAALPTLTIRLDPAARVWDVYSRSRLLADNLPLLAETKGQRRFSVRAGNEGVWITGLVMADENPLYEDENANGIDDRFEKEKRNGSLLAASASSAERVQLAKEWKAAQRKKAPPALLVNRPLPDSAN